MNELVLKNLEKGIIFICGDITEKSYFSFANKIRQIPDEVKEVIVYLHSEGGEVNSALAIVDEMNLLRTKGKKVITVGCGKCYSAAAIILVFGDERYGTEWSDYLLHMFSYEIKDGTHNNHQAYVNYTEDQYKNVMASMAIRCGRDGSKEIKKFLEETKNDLFLSCEKAIEFGLIEGKWNYENELR